MTHVSKFMTGEQRRSRFAMRLPPGAAAHLFTPANAFWQARWYLHTRRPSPFSTNAPPFCRNRSAKRFRSFVYYSDLALPHGVENERVVPKLIEVRQQGVVGDVLAHCSGDLGHHLREEPCLRFPSCHDPERLGQGMAAAEPPKFAP